MCPVNVYPAYCHQITSTIIYWILDSFFISAFPPFSCRILKTSISHSVLTGSIIIMLFGLLLLLFVGLDKLWSRIKGLTKETTKAIVAVVVWLYISDGSGLKPGPGPARSPGFLESPRPDFGRRAQARARPGPLVKSPGAQRALGIWLSFKKLALFWKNFE